MNFITRTSGYENERRDKIECERSSWKTSLRDLVAHPGSSLSVSQCRIIINGFHFVGKRRRVARRKSRVDSMVANIRETEWRVVSANVRAYETPEHGTAAIYYSSPQWHANNTIHWQFLLHTRRRAPRRSAHASNYRERRLVLTQAAEPYPDFPAPRFTV